jgi:hypothetical protein
MVDDNFSLLIIELSDSVRVDGVVILMDLSVKKSKNGVFFMTLPRLLSIFASLVGELKMI